MPEAFPYLIDLMAYITIGMPFAKVNAIIHAVNNQHKTKNEMKWLEIIELRSVDHNRDLLLSQLHELSNEMDEETGKQMVTTYGCVKFGSDFSIHLVHHSEEVEYGGSSLGIRLASALKEFGLVNHSIWVEMNNK